MVCNKFYLRANIQWRDSGRIAPSESPIIFHVSFGIVKIFVMWNTELSSKIVGSLKYTRIPCSFLFYFISFFLNLSITILWEIMLKNWRCFSKFAEITQNLPILKSYLRLNFLEPHRNISLLVRPSKLRATHPPSRHQFLSLWPTISYLCLTHHPSSNQFVFSPCSKFQIFLLN